MHTLALTYNLFCGSASHCILSPSLNFLTRKSQLNIGFSTFGVALVIRYWLWEVCRTQQMGNGEKHRNLFARRAIFNRKLKSCQLLLIVKSMNGNVEIAHIQMFGLFNLYVLCFFSALYSKFVVCIPNWFALDALKMEKELVAITMTVYYCA